MKETIHSVKPSTQYKREHKADYGHERIEILYEDADIIIINKPSGMLSVPYPGSKARTAIEVIEKIMRSKGTLTAHHKPFVVHRLDRDTSGVMMFALNEAAQKKITATWHTMVTERLYRAVAENPHDEKKYLPDFGTINDPLAKNAHHMGYVPHDANDKSPTVAARTHYRIVTRGTTHTLFELSLDTGKKNQIRAHLSSRNYPLAGDENYRAQTDPFHRLALHARTLAFKHPVTEQKMKFEVPEPEEWKTYVEKGDPHPQTPIWLEKRAKSAIPRQSSYSSGARSSASKKDLRHMDFISRGKALGKKY